MLFLVFLMLLLGLFALFLGGGIVAQGFLYQNPAERLPLRSALAALLVASFVTFWVWIDRRNPGRFDTLFNFVGYTTADFNEFEAVRWTAGGEKLLLGPDGKPLEKVTTFKRTGGKDAKFVDEKGEAYQRSGGQSMTSAIRVKVAGDAEPVRYNATLKENPRTKAFEYTSEARFVEEKGSRYVESERPGTLFVPSTGTIAGALALNALLFVVWLAAIWPVMRFSFGHALMFATALGVLTMLGVMPLLFKTNRDPKPVSRIQDSGFRIQGGEQDSRAGIRRPSTWQEGAATSPFSALNPES